MAETDAKSAASPAAETKTEAGAAAEAVGEHDWLEEVASESNLEWVRAQNSDTLQRLGNPEEAPLYGRVLDILNSKDKIPYVHRRDNWFYNFWTDDEHTQGIWRRTTLESFETPDPEWQILLDLDELSKQEGETWVWKGSVWWVFFLVFFLWARFFVSFCAVLVLLRAWPSLICGVVVFLAKMACCRV